MAHPGTPSLLASMVTAAARCPAVRPFRGTISAMTTRIQWLTPLGLVMVAVVVLSAVLGDAGAAGSGAGLANLLAAVVFGLTAVAFLVRPALPEPAYVALMLLMAGSLVAMRVADPNGQVIGLFLASAFAPLRRPRTVLAVVVLLGVLSFNVAQLGSGQTALGLIIATDAGAAFFFLVGALLRREREQREQITALLQELEVSREAEKMAYVADERTRMAREVHDVLAHTLSGLALHLEAARMLAGSTGPDPQLHGAIERAHQLSRAGLEESRRAVRALRGDSLPGPELIPSLIEQHRLASPASTSYTVSGEPVALPPDAALALYRTVQEALSNVRKHAAGACVEVSLRWGPGSVEVTVTDNGSCHVASSMHGYGLSGMAERAQLAGGTLAAGPYDGGFQVSLSVPVGLPSDDDGWRVGLPAEQ